MTDLIAQEYHDCDLSFKIKAAETWIYRSPTKVPVRTSFGTMRERPALFLSIEDSQGNIGIGEVWCNFPNCGDAHRANLLNAVILPAIIDQEFSDPASCYSVLQKQFERLAIQAGEFGPIAQCIAGIDIALWDMVAKRLDAPLYRLFGGSDNKINVYASGINPTGAPAAVERCRTAGYTAFKLKIGFGSEVDNDNIARITDRFSSTESLMVDANQAWDFEQAVASAAHLAQYPIAWLEEPMLVTTPSSDWEKLAAKSPIPLAGGENIADPDEFSQAIAGNWLDVIQPDVCKWGGFSAVLPVAKETLTSNKRYCPHFLGGGIGLIASAHLLAAVGGNGLLEIDSNPNPLRQLLYDPDVQNGITHLSEAAGLGVDIEMLHTLQQHPLVNRVQ